MQKRVFDKVKLDLLFAENKVKTFLENVNHKHNKQNKESNKAS